MKETKELILEFEIKATPENYLILSNLIKEGWTLKIISGQAGGNTFYFKLIRIFN